MKVAIVNLGRIVTGNWREPFATGDAIFVDGERIAAIGGVISRAVPRFVGRSRNTPATTRKARVAASRITQDFSAATH